MKKITLLFILIWAGNVQLMAQTTVYNKSHQKLDFTSEDIQLNLKPSGIKPGGPQLAPALLAAIPTVIDFGFKITTSILEKKVKQFSAEYSKHNSYLEVKTEEMPNIEFSRFVAFNGNDVKSETEPALLISLKAERVAGKAMERYIYYYVSDLNLKYSSAKSTSGFPTMDYTIELKLDYVVDKEMKTLELAPIVISSMSYKSNPLMKDKYRTNLIPIPEDGAIIGASIKIVETNPGKVRAEKILSLWNDNKDDVRTIINNFVPKEKDEEKKDDAKGEAAATSVNGDDESSNKPAEQTNKKKP